MFFVSQPQQHKSKHKNKLKVDKKEAVKGGIHYIIGHANNSLYRCNKRHYNLHAHCTLKRIKHKRKKT